MPEGTPAVTPPVAASIPPVAAPGTPPPVVAAPAVPPVVAPPATPAADDSLLGGDDKDKGAGPADVEVTFPKEFKADDGLVTEFKGVAKELGLKSEQAQKFADFYVKSEQAKAAKGAADDKAMRAEWRASAAKDGEYGGEKFGENVKLADQAYRKFAPVGLQKLFKETGLVNHPEVIRHFFKLGRADAEPTGIKSGSPAVGGEVDAIQALSNFYSKPKS